MPNRTILLLLALLSPMAQALEESRVNGGIAVLPLPIQSEAMPEVYFLLHRVLTVRNEAGQWQAVVGLPVGQMPGEAQIEILRPSKSQLSFTVKKKHYEEQHLHLENTRQVNPSPEDLSRINTELQEQNSAYASFSPAQPPLEFTLLPTAGSLASHFGLQRFFNGEPRAPHSGIDLSAPEGQEVVAPASGTIIKTGDYFFNGKTVMIDHGSGMISMLCHLSQIAVKEGQPVKVGEKIGQVGHTGRATGPHLHWSISMNAVRIDPLLLLSAELRANLLRSPQHEKVGENKRQDEGK